MSLSCTLFHLRAGREAAREVLGLIPGGGVILAHNDLWTTVLVDLQDFPQAREGHMLVARVDFAEDIGFWLQFFKQGTKLGVIELMWSPVDTEMDGREPVARIGPGLLEGLLRGGTISATSALALQSFVANFPERRDASTDVAEAVAALLEFPIASGYFDIDIDQLRERLPEAEDIEGV